MPLIRRLPKRGFNNAAFKTSYALVNLGDLEQFESGAHVTEQFLREKGLPCPPWLVEQRPQFTTQLNSNRSKGGTQ